MSTESTALEEARRAGIDLDLLDANLAVPVKERWRLHDEALALVVKLETARRDRDEKLKRSAASAR